MTNCYGCLNATYCMCNLNVVEDEYHFIPQCEKYIDVRRKYSNKYYWQKP